MNTDKIESPSFMNDDIFMWRTQFLNYLHESDLNSSSVRELDIKTGVRKRRQADDTFEYDYGKISRQNRRNSW